MEENKPKYVPRKDHPWKRSYKVNLTQEKAVPQMKVKALKVFISEIVDNWDHLSINGEMDDVELAVESFSTMSDKQKAKWLADLLNRVYVNGVW